MEPKKFNISETIKQAEKELGLESGGYFKPKDGANRFRLLSPALAHASFYKGERTFKYVAWIYDYADSRVKLYFMPTTVLRAIESLQISPDYKFEEVPMPYDVTLQVKNAGTKEVDYQVMGARANTPMSADCLEQFANKEDIEVVVAKLKEKDQTDPMRQPPAPSPAPQRQEPTPETEEIRLEDIPY